jgi:hypothetical protein
VECEFDRGACLQWRLECHKYPQYCGVDQHRLKRHLLSGQTHTKSAQASIQFKHQVHTNAFTVLVGELIGDGIERVEWIGV